MLQIKESLVTFAENTPTLLQFDFHIHGDLHISDKVTKHAIPNAREELSRIAPKCRQNVRNMQYGEILYCLTIYEILRHKNEDVISSSFVYLADEHLERETQLYPVITNIVHQRIIGYMETIRQKQFHAEEEYGIRDTFMFLLKTACSRNPIVQSLAQELINLHISRSVPDKKILFRGLDLSTCFSYEFPYLLEDRHVLYTALDLLGVVHNSLFDKFDSLTHTVELPLKKVTISLPPGTKEKKDIFEFLKLCISEMFGKALYINSKDIMACFAGYIYTSNRAIKSQENLEVSHIVNFSISLLNYLYYTFKLSPEMDLHPSVPHFDPTRFHSWFMHNTLGKKVGTVDSGI